LEKVRVRFAPSPTGYLHVGGARTALFNWLFTRSQGGTFILRIEDTDVTRSTPESLSAILESLRWLGLNWDEGPEVGGPYGPYFQSQRLSIYQEYARRVLEKGTAYWCFCRPEELARRRQEAVVRREAPRYDGRCRNLSLEEVESRRRKSYPAALRFRIPPGTTIFQDIIRGEVKFENQELDDFVMLKSDGLPTYNFAVVVDDVAMKITHVIRGEDHISNTPRQILVYQALDLPLPKFAHLSLILGPDRDRLSKRHGAVSVLEYRDRGYLPEAFVNYLALLGWSYDDRQQIFSGEELEEKFSLEKVSRSAAIFDRQKLDWMNGYYIRQLDLNKLTDLCIPFLIEQGLLSPEDTRKKYSWIKEIISLEKDRLKFLSHIGELTAYFFQERIDFIPLAAQRYLQPPDTKERLRMLMEGLEALPVFTPSEIEKVFQDLMGKLKIKLGDLVHPVRVVLTGRTVSPGIYDVIALLGKETTCRRIQKAMACLPLSSPTKKRGDSRCASSS